LGSHGLGGFLDSFFFGSFREIENWAEFLDYVSFMLDAFVPEHLNEGIGFWISFCLRTVEITPDSVVTLEVVIEFGGGEGHIFIIQSFCFYLD
jgi:hypothetical protein